MDLLTSTLTDVINQIAKSIQISTLVPSSILMLFNIVFVSPAFGMDVSTSLFSIGLVVLLIVALSFFLWLINGPAIRALEGYTFLDTWYGRILVKKHSKDLQRIDEVLSLCAQELNKADHWLREIIPSRYEPRDPRLFQDSDFVRISSQREQWSMIRAKYLEERWNHFPSINERVLPTKLGNTIAAFEHYPFDRYGIDGPVVWPRMIPILDQNGFAPYVEREKSAFDFLLNLGIVLTLLAIECLGVAGLLLQAHWALVSAIAAVMVVIAYHFLVVNAVYWGDMTKVAFDFYRHDLRKALLFRDPNDLEDERAIWRSISGFLAINSPPPSIHWEYSRLHSANTSSPSLSQAEKGSDP